MTFQSPDAGSLVPAVACALGILLSLPAQAQVCPGDLTLSSQADVDSFACSEVTGNLVISGADIVNLDGLASLTTVGANLEIDNNPILESVDGLSSLTSAFSLVISDNPLLTNVDALASVTTVMYLLGISSNASLTRCCGLYPLLSSVSPPASVSVGNNGVGCSSAQDILDGGPCPPISTTAASWGSTKSLYR